MTYADGQHCRARGREGDEVGAGTGRQLISGLRGAENPGPGLNTEALASERHSAPRPGARRRQSLKCG